MVNLHNLSNLSTEEKVNSLVDNAIEMQQNVKWLYKYGGAGTGSGSGNGSGASTNLKEFLIIFYNDDEQYTCTSSSTTSVTIYPTKGKSKQVSFKVRYMDATHTYQFRYYLNESSDYTTINLDDDNQGFVTLSSAVTEDNGSFIIRGYDKTDEVIININVKFIVSPVKVYHALYGIPTGSTLKVLITSKEILMGNYTLIYTRFYYTFYSDGSITYLYKLVGSSETTTITVDSSKYLLETEYYQDSLLVAQDFLSNESNLGTYDSNTVCYYTSTEGSSKDLEMESLAISLIPSSLYVELTMDKGTIYKQGESIPEDKYVYEAGTRTFNLKIYNGVSDNDKYYNVQINVLDEDEVPIFTSDVISSLLYERTSISYSKYVKCDSNEVLKDASGDPVLDENGKEIIIPKEYTIHVTFTDDSGLSHDVPFRMFIEKDLSDFDWIKLGTEDTTYSEFYFNRESECNILVANKNSGILKCTRALTGFTQALNIQTSTDATEVMYSFGIQFSEVNPSTVRLIRLYDITKTTNYIDIYQDKIDIGGSEISIYIPKEDYSTYNTTSGTYHMLTLYRRVTGKAGDTVYYEWVVYMDGVIEGALSAFTTLTNTYNTLEINPDYTATSNNYSGNFLINHIGIYVFNVGNYILNNNIYAGMHDIGVVQYYYKYINTSTGNPNENYAKILNSMKDFSFLYDANGNIKPYITVSLNVMLSIASMAGIPTVVLGVNKAILDDINKTDWGEEDSFDYDCTYVLYRKAGLESSFETCSLKTGISKDDIVFNIALQGSSTKGYIVKNFELSVAASNSSEMSNIPIYSFDYDSNDADSFYPELSFTFKADQVDSSHSNNTTCGAIINDYMSKYPGGQKNCLTGKPVLFILDTGDDNDSEYQILGIYNYNLGRNSRFNLGHADKPIEITSSGFIVEAVSSINYKNDFAVAEIQNNSSYWDFSLYDDSILFQGYCYADSTCTETFNDLGMALKDLDVQDTKYMWGDIKYNTDTHRTFADVKDSITGLMKAVSELGGSIFQAVGKTLDEKLYQESSLSLNIAYKDASNPTHVPNCLTLYKRYRLIDSNSIYYKYALKETSTTDLSKDNRANLFKTCIYTEQDGEEVIEPVLDFDSALLYYVICMGLGLVDSVEKNLNIKTWDMHKWYVAFYDMDTSFGLNNAGKYISPFAFSDYWKSDSKGTVTIYRDYWDSSDSTNTGYDIPSSYLFAITKYSEFVRSHTLGLVDDTTYKKSTPAIEWSYLRDSNGKFRSADYVMKTYFKKNTENINEAVWNLNYRYKYLRYQSTETSKDESGNSVSTAIMAKQYNATAINFFHGRRYYYTKDWLNKRFHVLDAYFNVNNMSTVLNEAENIVDALDNSNSGRINPSLASNEDVIIKRQIFGDGTTGIKTSNDIASSVKVNEFSPFIIYGTDIPTGIIYLFNEADTLYSFEANVSGNQAHTFYGSGNWSYLDSINSYLYSGESITVTSNLLEEISSDRKDNINIPYWNFYTPSLLKLTLTGPYYSGNLRVYYGLNVKTIDLSGTAISISEYNSDQQLNTFSALQTLNLTNSKASVIKIDNATKLTNLLMSGAVIDTLEIVPIMNNVNFSNTNITNLTITADGSLEAPSCTITGDKSLETLTLNGFASVTLSNCPKLKKIVFDNDSLINLSITECSTNITTGTYLLIGTTANVADLSAQTKLDTVNFNTMAAIQTLKLPAAKYVTAASKAFYKNTNLSTLTGMIKVTDAVSLFSECYKLKLASGNPTLLTFDSSITSLDYMCSMSSKGIMDNSSAKFVKDSLTSAGIVNKITSMTCIFYNNAITSLSSFIEKNDTLASRLFTACTSFNLAFALNNITETITSESLNIGSDSLLNIDNVFMGNLLTESNHPAPSYTTLRMTYGALTLLDTYSDGTRGRLKAFCQKNTGIIICDSAGNSVGDTVILANFWGNCKSLTRIGNVSDGSGNGGVTFKNGVIDFTPLVTDAETIYAIPSTVTDIGGFMEYYNFTAKNPNKAFSNLSNLTNFNSNWHNSMWTGTLFLDANGSNTNSDGTAFVPDIWEMFDWNNIYNKLTSAFYVGIDSNYNAFNFSRTISYEHFITLLNLIFKSTSMTRVWRIFYNCTITGYETSENYDSANKVLHILGSSLSTNTTITSAYANFYGLKLKSSNDTRYIDFQEGMFLKWVKCIRYKYAWAGSNLYKLYSNWFLTSDANLIVDMSYAFSGCKFKIPHADTLYSGETYYLSSSIFYPSVNLAYQTIKNTSIPSTWSNHYIVDPILFNNITKNADLTAMFEDSNLFGVLPKPLFNNLDNSWTELNMSEMFSGVLIVPYIDKYIYEINMTDTDTEPLLYKIAICCFVPNGDSENEPYVYSSNYISGTKSYRYLDKAFNTKLFIPKPVTNEYHVKKEVLTKAVTDYTATLEDATSLTYPILLDEDTVTSWKTNKDMVTETEYDAIVDADVTTDFTLIYQMVYSIPFLYVYNTNSITWESDYVGFLPLACNAALPISKTCSYHTSGELDSVDRRTYINARYGGGYKMIDIFNSEDGLPQGTGELITATGLLLSTLVSLYYGPIFERSVKTSSLNLTEDSILITDWKGSQYVNEVYMYVFSRNIYLPRASETVTYFASTYTLDNDTTIYKMYVNSALVNSSATLKSNYSSVFVFD